LLLVIVVVMAEGKDIHTSEQEKDPGKRPPWWKRLWRRGSQKRTRQRKAWTLREFGGKTVWDWLQLLIVPFALVVISFLFTMQQDARQQRIEDQRAEAERTIQQQNAQDEALQAYLDQMSTLLLEKDLRDSEPDSEVRTLARARTLTVLGRFDPSRKRQVLRFLAEADLITSVDESDPVISLGLADLRGVNLRANILSGAHLVLADLRYAELSGADLSFAELYSANLRGTALNNADLSNANLSNADLSYADLSDAKGVSNEELEQQAAFLEGTTMPSGQKYEDWLKSKGRGEDGENP